jgi:hypothetical protein
MQRYGIENTVQVPFLYGLADQKRETPPSGRNLRVDRQASQRSANELALSPPSIKRKFHRHTRQCGKERQRLPASEHKRTNLSVYTLYTSFGSSRYIRS